MAIVEGGSIGPRGTDGGVGAMPASPPAVRHVPASVADIMHHKCIQLQDAHHGKHRRANITMLKTNH